MTNRVSRKVVVDALKEFLPTGVALQIYDRIYDETIKEAENQIGMTFGDWKSRFDDDFDAVWAADTPGFGRAGGSCYGDCDGCRIVRITTGRKQKVLHLWDDVFGSIDSAKKPYLIRNMGSDEIRDIRGSYESLGDAIADAKEHGLKRFECFRWEGVSSTGDDMWAFAFRTGKEV